MRQFLGLTELAQCTQIKEHLQSCARIRIHGGKTQVWKAMTCLGQSYLGQKVFQAYLGQSWLGQVNLGQKVFQTYSGQANAGKALCCGVLCVCLCVLCVCLCVLCVSVCAVCVCVCLCV